jgi:hypothetical protein
MFAWSRPRTFLETAVETTLVEFLRPVRTAAFERPAPSGYEFTCASRRTSPPADRRSLTGIGSLPELPRIA